MKNNLRIVGKQEESRLLINKSLEIGFLGSDPGKKEA
jgi:hypothetical protein